MLNMLNDPEIDKLIIYTLVGICAVLMLAVFFLAVKKNVYYVDDYGVEVPPPPKKKLFGFGKKEEEPRPAAAPQEPVPASVTAEEPVYAEDIPAVAETIVAPVVTPEPEVPAAPEAPTEEKPNLFKKLFSFGKKEKEPEPAETAEAAEEESPASDVPASEDSFAGEFSIPVFPSEPAEPVELPEEIPADFEEIPERLMNEADVDAAVDEFMTGLPEEESEEVPAEVPAEEAELDDVPVKDESVRVPTGVEVAVVIGNNVREYSINQLPCLLGREAASCDLVIPEPAVSRRHARILIADQQLCVEDVSEHNGTFLNATKLPSLGRAPLNAGDRITLGRATIDVTKVLY
ncbi:MAG: FHA domain-containing protein [Solobacterium sp.]|nr:FHA domain-containing protein [Solobacterium sp.]